MQKPRNSADSLSAGLGAALEIQHTEDEGGGSRLKVVLGPCSVPIEAEGDQHTKQRHTKNRHRKEPTYETETYEEQT
jgi:hypothetical protein